MSTRTAGSVLAELAEMPAQQFRSVCEADVRSATGKGEEIDPLVTEALRTPPVLQRYYRTLSVLQRSAEGQLAARRAAHAARMARLRRGGVKGAEYQDEVAEHENWRAGALRFKTGVEERLVELAGILRDVDAEFFADRVKDERNQALLRAMVLEDAVRRHSEHECGDECQGEDGCAADRELWSVLDYREEGK